MNKFLLKHWWRQSQSPVVVNVTVDVVVDVVVVVVVVVNDDDDDVFPAVVDNLIISVEIDFCFCCKCFFSAAA